LFEKHGSNPYLNQESIKLSAAYRGIERQTACIEPEIALWRRESDIMAHVVQDIQNQLKFDADQRLRFVILFCER
jgi:hypothetical protein